MEKRAVFLFVVLTLGAGTGCAGRIRFSRRQSVSYKRRISVPDEAVIYMQNLALMRDTVSLKGVKHVELVLPPRIIIESLQLRVGDKQIAEYNVEQKKYTRVRIKNVDQYVKGGKPLLVEYLTWGIYWSAQYRVDLDESGVKLQLGALVTNRSYDLSELKVTLVAGWVGVSPDYRSSRERNGEATRKVWAKTAPGPKAPRWAHLLGWQRSRGPRGPFERQNSAAPALPLKKKWAWAKVSKRSAVQRKNPYVEKRSRQRTRAFEADLLNKYRIHRVDKTARHRRSNFQKQFSRYYRGAQGLLGNVRRAFINRISGYSLYPGLKVELRKGENSYVRMAGLRVESQNKYLWPADRGTRVFKIHQVKNTSRILLPAGNAWIYRKGVFIGQDLVHWTPKGASTLLTTSNDGSVSVDRKRRILKNGATEWAYKIHNHAPKKVTVEVFARNPSWRREGALAYTPEPKTKRERGRFHRWELTVAPKSEGKIQVTFTSNKKKQSKKRPQGARGARGARGTQGAQHENTSR